MASLSLAPYLFGISSLFQRLEDFSCAQMSKKFMEHLFDRFLLQYQGLPLVQ
jgi:hypothetical protein